MLTPPSPSSPLPCPALQRTPDGLPSLSAEARKERRQQSGVEVGGERGSYQCYLCADMASSVYNEAIKALKMGNVEVMERHNATGGGDGGGQR